MKFTGIKCSYNFFYIKKLNLNLQEQKQTLHLIYKILQEKLFSDESNYCGVICPQSTNLYSQYNYLLFPFKETVKLYNEIKSMFYLCDKKAKTTNYSIQCWLNYYNKGQYIDWHQHWPPQYDAWHGIYCIDVEPNSSTTYRIPTHQKEIVIESRNNLLILNKSSGDFHKSSEWLIEDRPRLTVAFDIVPTEKLSNINHESFMNHWIPM